MLYFALIVAIKYLTDHFLSICDTCDNMQLANIHHIIFSHQKKCIINWWSCADKFY
jgi:hypothetical protein